MEFSFWQFCQGRTANWRPLAPHSPQWRLCLQSVGMPSWPSRLSASGLCTPVHFGFMPQRPYPTLRALPFFLLPPLSLEGRQRRKPKPREKAGLPGTSGFPLFDAPRAMLKKSERLKLGKMFLFLFLPPPDL